MIELKILFESIIICVLVTIFIGLVTGILTLGFKDISWFFEMMKFPPVWMAMIASVILTYLRLVSANVS